MSKKRKDVNLNDIANRCGFSIATISRVINDKGNVREETRKKVLDILRDYNISPGNKFVNSKSRYVVLFFNNKLANIVGVSNGKYGIGIEGIEKILHSKGYSIVLSKITEDNILPDIVRNEGAIGVILLGDDIPVSIVTLLAARGIPFVIVDGDSYSSKYFSVNTDDADGIQKAVAYLVELGHRKIAYLSGNMKSVKYKKRYNAFKEEIERHNLAYFEEFIKIQDNLNEDEEFGSIASEELLSHDIWPTAIIASSDNIAKGSISALKRNDIRIPEDISIVSFSDCVDLIYSNIKVTAVRSDWVNKEKTAAAILLQLIDGISIDPYRCLVNTELIPGDTCTRYRRNMLSKSTYNSLVYWTEGGKLYEHEKNIIYRWNKNHPESIVTYNPTPKGMETEIIIKSSIIKGTFPDVIQGIEIFFANNLASHEVLVPLDTLEDFSTIIKERKMDKLLNQLKAPDGHIYVIPQHWTPVLGMYNKSLLEAADIENPPRTYREFNEFAESLKKITDTKALDFIPSSNWWIVARYWNTFHMAAMGEKGVHFDIYKIDTPENRDFLEFISNAVKKGYASNDTCKYDFVKKKNIGYILEVTPIEFKDIVMSNSELRYVFSPPPVPTHANNDGQPWIEASIKGASIFKKSKNVENAWRFLKWYYLRPENDLDLLKITSHIPCRGDLLNNSIFLDYFTEFPDVTEFVNYMGKSYTITHPDKIEVFNIINEKLWKPLLLHNQDIDILLEETVKHLNELIDYNDKSQGAAVH